MTDFSFFRCLAFGTLLIVTACATPPPPTSPAVDTPRTAQDLLGTWDVALYFSQDSPPSATVMEIEAVNPDGTLGGTFYSSAFELGRFTKRGEAILISVITSDGSGPYATSGRLVAPNQIEGQTLSSGRDFLMTWSATKR